MDWTNLEASEDKLQQEDSDRWVKCYWWVQGDKVCPEY